MLLKDSFKISPTRLLVWITVLCLFVFLSAYFMEHYFGILSCKLCVYERLVFIVAGIISFLSFLLFPPRLQSVLIFALGLIFFFGGFLALYHVAVQNHIVPLPLFCNSGDFGGIDSVEALRETLLNTPFVRCDQITWSFLGISLAGYNVLLSFFMTFLCWGWMRFHVMDETIKR